MDRFMIISSDCHAGLPVDRYREYLEARYHEELDRYLQQRRDLRLGELVREESAEAVDEDRMRFTVELDPERRLKQMEADGVVAEVVFPDVVANNEIPFSGLFGTFGGVATRYSRELQAAGHRAYNRWLAEFCVPDRQAGLARVLYHDIEAAVREIRWAGNVGLRGVMLDGVDPTDELPPLFDPYYEPIWTACEDQGLPVNFHFGAGNPEHPEDADILSSEAARRAYGTEAAFWCHRPLWFLISGGVLDRHPDLQVVFTEAGSDWIPGTIANMDWDFEKNPFTIGENPLSLKPSEYWYRQCFVGASALSLVEVEMRHRIGVRQMMFGTDFPHPDSTWGRTTRYLQATFGAAGVPEDEARAILGENAARCYKLDVKKLKAIAERVGPRIDEVLSKPEAPETDPLIVNFVGRPPGPLISQL